MKCQIKVPQNIFSGEGSLEKVTEICMEERAERIFIVSDEGIKKAGLLKKLTDILDGDKKEYQIFDNVKAEPSWQDAQDGVIQAKNYQCDLMIGIGGGSVIDTAKICSLLIGTDKDVKDLLENPVCCKKRIPTLMIPTTCGTGAEATCNAIVAIPEEQTKQGIVNQSMIPDYVILDPQMIRKIPKQIIASSGVDALAHVVECYTSKKATALSDMYAAEGAKLIFHNIEKAYKNEDDMDAKEKMLIGAFYGGIAITGSGTTAVHALSYPLGGKYHIAHGVSNAILFAHVMRFNKDACETQLGNLCDAVYPEKSQLATEEKADYIIRRIEEIVKNTDIPTDLNKFGVKKEDMDFLVEAGSRQQRLLVNNRKELTKEDIKNIYAKVLK